MALLSDSLPADTCVEFAEVGPYSRKPTATLMASSSNFSPHEAISMAIGASLPCVAL